MAARSRITPFTAIDNQSIATNVIGDYTDIGNLDNACYIVLWQGISPVGQVVVECTNQDPKKYAAPTWSQLDFGSTITISGNSGDHVLNVKQAPFNFIRIRYIATSGSGTMTAILHVKQLGA